MSNSQNQNRTELCFTGDLYLRARGEMDNLFDEQLLEFLNSGDNCFFNYGSPVTGYRKSFDKYVPKPRRDRNYSAEDALDEFTEIFPNGIISLADDHLGDRGAVGIIDTLENFDKRGISYMGAGRTPNEKSGYMIVGDDVKVGVIPVLGETYGIGKFRNKIGAFRDEDKEMITNLIKEVRSKADYVVMIYHGGKRYNHVVEPEKRSKLKSYLDAGCDVIVSHHSHSVQRPEKIGDKYLFYSLGDLYLTERADVTGSDPEGAVLKITFGKNGIECDMKMLSIGDHSVRLGEDSCPPYISDEAEYTGLWKSAKSEAEKNQEAYIVYNNLWTSNAYKAERDNILRTLDLIEKNRDAADLEGIEEKLRKRLENLTNRLEVFDTMELNDAEAGDIESEEEREDEQEKMAKKDLI